MLINRKIKRAFSKVKFELVGMRKNLTNGLFALSTEYAKLQIRIQELEKKVDMLESKNVLASELNYNYVENFSDAKN